MSFEVLGSGDSRRPEKPFLEDEVFAAPSNHCRDKASEPDGFTMVF